MTDPVAVIDIGSGSVKLLITGPDGLVDLGSTLAHQGVKTKLVAGSESLITEQALADSARAFDEFKELIVHHGVSNLRVVGTAACRSASNVDELSLLVTDRFDTELEVLSGQREAELSFAGAIAGRSIDGSIAVIDIGAGSTEFAIRNADGHLDTLSLPVGGQTLLDQYLHSDPHLPSELSSALTVMELHLDDLRREVPSFGETIDGATVIGVGAATVIGAVEIGSLDPGFRVDGEVLEKAGVEEVFRALATETAEERAFNPGLKPIHAGDIVGAMCVLVEFMRQFAVPDIMISERGLMHGLSAELLAGS